jgi:hypothetical protein
MRGFMRVCQHKSLMSHGCGTSAGVVNFMPIKSAHKMAGKMSEPVGETLVLAREGRPKCFAGELFEVFVQPRGFGGDIFHDDTGGLFLRGRCGRSYASLCADYPVDDLGAVLRSEVILDGNIFDEIGATTGHQVIG